MFRSGVRQRQENSCVLMFLNAMLLVDEAGLDDFGLFMKEANEFRDGGGIRAENSSRLFHRWFGHAPDDEAIRVIVRLDLLDRFLLRRHNALKFGVSRLVQS